MQADPGIDAYLAAQSPEHRDLLQGVRDRVASLVPQATERISYGMPTFFLGRRGILSVAAWKRHCSIYAVHDDLLAGHAAAVAGYGRTKSALHFTQSQPLPDALLDDLIRERVATIEAGGR